MMLVDVYKLLINKIKSFFKGDERTIKVKKNAFASFLIKGVSVIVSLLLVPLTLDYVSSEVYGVWLTLSTVIVWVGFFDIGFSLGLKNKLVEAIAKHEWGKGKSLVSTMYALMAFIFIPVGLVLIILIPYIDWPTFLNVDPSYNNDIILSLNIVICCFCIQMIAHVIIVVCQAFQMVAYGNAFNVIGNVISLIAIIIMKQCVPGSLVYLSIVLSLAPVFVMLIASSILYRTRFKDVRPSIKSIDRKYVGELFDLGYKFFILNVQVLVVSQTTNFLISNVSGPDAVTSYNIANRYIGVGSMLFGMVLAPLWPAFTDAHTKNDITWMKRVYGKMTKFTHICQLLVLLMLVLSPLVYIVWIGDRANVAFSMSLAVSGYYLVQIWSALHVVLINGLGYLKLQTYMAIITSICHIPLSLLFGHLIGAEGVLLSLIFVNVLYAIFSTLQVRKVLSETARGIWLK